MSIILRIAVPSPLRQIFDYLPPQNFASNLLQPGLRVLVTFGRQKLVGLIIEIATSTTVAKEKLKPVLSVLDQEPLLTKPILDLIKWTSNYYHHPIGDVITTALPALLRRETCKNKYEYNQIDIKNALKNIQNSILLNAHQQQAIANISANLNTFQTYLLDGITGSGKTEVYLQVIQKILAAGKQALVLVPEINLTPQTVARFQERFPIPLAILHSKRNDRERLNSWLMAKDASAAIIIGTRTAIFTPLKNPGIIILDEEHDLSFKQQAGLRYCARDLAIVRAKQENIPVILGSATPSLESIHNTNRKRFVHLSLPNRTGNATQPTLHLIDMRNQKLKHGITETLIQSMKECLEKQEQILIFLNRRGFAPILICHSCGWTGACNYCDARLTYHQKQKQLHCHHCGVMQRVPEKCPNCANDKLIPLGLGTERVEATLQSIFPNTKIIRIDRDTTRRKGTIQTMFEQIHKNEYQILIGTQMLAKGHHFPDVTLVAILNVDNGLFSSDFRSSEHLAQLVTQVAGRAGRAEKIGKVYLQTHNPQHPLLQNLITQGYSSFAQAILEERQNAQLPPFAHLALLHAESKIQEAALQFLTQIRNQIATQPIKNVNLLGPIPNLMEKKAGYFRAQMLIQSKDRQALHQNLDLVLSIITELKPNRGIRWYLDVDPI